MSVLAVACMIVLIAGCEYSLKEQPPVAPGPTLKISVSPTLDTLLQGTTLKLTAKVTGSSDSRVLWSISSGPGSIDSTGLYTAPASIDSPAVTVIVRAQAHADTSVSATARIVVVQELILPVIVTVSPGTTSLSTGETKQFTATVTGTTNTGVLWSMVSGPGTIDNTGLYTAPTTIPSSPATAIIQAVSTADTSASSQAVITITEDTPVPYDGVCFQRDVLPIFNSSCATSNCHDIITHEEEYILRAYADTTIGGERYRGIHSLELSTFRDKVVNGTGKDQMPPEGSPRLTQAQIDTILKWYNEGARNTACPDTSGGCDTSNVSYNGLLTVVLQNNCVGCHTGATTVNRNVDLSTYDGVKRVALDGRLVGSIEQAYGFIAMPQNGDKLSDCLIRKIRAWVNRGAPNN